MQNCVCVNFRSFEVFTHCWNNRSLGHNGAEEKNKGKSKLEVKLKYIRDINLKKKKNQRTMKNLFKLRKSTSTSDGLALSGDMPSRELDAQWNVVVRKVVCSIWNIIGLCLMLCHYYTA